MMMEDAKASVGGGINGRNEGGRVGGQTLLMKDIDAGDTLRGIDHQAELGLGRCYVDLRGGVRPEGVGRQERQVPLLPSSSLSLSLTLTPPPQVFLSLIEYSESPRG
ncbi:hypothetical protein Pcinc_022229 [Petrolisthes cinctipes]|uniref:Uncharacterized protein n=1 Tax=Petrolisthes cinctipes TaxID=88211 RepID=A0AAE1FGI6_PETCI|nr:hypothetical protein Pcinc_022229 [Petrolisthes cinctipes]